MDKDGQIQVVSLKKVATEFEEKHDQKELGKSINFKLFTTDPSINPSLGFIIKTPWTHKKIEALHLKTKSLPT